MPLKKRQLPVILIVIILLLPGIYFLPGILGWIPYSSPETRFTDLLISHYPNTLFLKNSIINHQQIPLWSDLINSGVPFAANPLSSLFYPPAWLGMIFPLPEGISILLAVHAIFGAWGMFLFLRDKGLSDLAAIMGALLFGMSPKIAVHYGAGHVTLIYALSWTPWLFFTSGKDRTGWKTGLVAAGLFLADPRWSIPAGLIWFFYVVAHRQKDKFHDQFSYFLKAGITAFLISAPLIFPMLQYVSLSTRAEMGMSDIFGLSLPVFQLIGLVIPASAGNFEWFIYFGGIPVLLFLRTMLSGKLRVKNLYWLYWVLIGVFLSVVPGFLESDWMIKIPGISLLRVPARNMYLVGFSLAVICANTLDRFIAEGENRGNEKLYLGIGVISLVMMIGISVILGEVKLLALWGILTIYFGSVILLLSTLGNFNRKTAALILLVLVIIDMSFAGFSNFVLKPETERQHSLLEFVKNDDSVFRVYSPSYSIPQEYGAELSLRLADGVDPLQIAQYSNFMQEASGVQSEGYSVTIPAYSSGNPAIDNKDAVPNLFLLGLLNVKYIVSDFELNIPGLSQLQISEGPYQYQNEFFMPYAWMETEELDRTSFETSDYDQIQIINRTPNKITIKTTGPGKLVLSEVIYPGWVATLDSQAVPLVPAYDLLRSVEIPAGQHIVEFIFRPVSVFLGMGCGLIGLMVSVWRIRRNEN